MKKRNLFLVLLFLFLILALAGYWLYHLEMHYKTILSPCGKYRAECYSIFQQLFKFIPHNGDSSGERDPYPAYKEAEPRFPFDVSPG